MNLTNGFCPKCGDELPAFLVGRPRLTFIASSQCDICGALREMTFEPSAFTPSKETPPAASETLSSDIAA